jgi:hypothetical protein
VLPACLPAFLLCPPLWPACLPARLPQDEVVTALRDYSKMQTSRRLGHVRPADGGGRRAATGAASRREQAAPPTATVAPAATLAGRVRKAGSVGAPALSIDVRRRVARLDAGEACGCCLHGIGACTARH